MEENNKNETMKSADSESVEKKVVAEVQSEAIAEDSPENAESIDVENQKSKSVAGEKINLSLKKLTVSSWEEQKKAAIKNKASNVEVGDYVALNYKVIEGEKERVQTFEGTVIAKKGNNSINSTITIRRSTKGYNLERVVPCFSQRIDSIKIIKKSNVRRAKLFYLRRLSGKKARLTEKI